MRQFDRGGNPAAEQEHGRLLIKMGQSATWGGGGAAGQARVRRRAQWLCEVLGLHEGVKAIECGCGTGIFTRETAKSGADIMAVDISSDLLQVAESEVRFPNARFVQDNLESPEHLPDASFDALYGVSVLHHLDLEKALAALRVKLKPGAKFAFSEPNLCNPINRYYVFVPDKEKRRQRGVSPDEMAFEPQELLSFFQNAGFVVTSLLHRDFLHPATPRPLIPVVATMGRIAEMLPGVRRWSGSLWICGTFAG